MKNFLILVFSPIKASWWWLLDSFRPPEPKTFDSYFLDMMYVEFMKNFLLPDSSELLAVRLNLAFQSPKTFDSYFLDMMYADFMRNFLLADSRELLAVILIWTSWPKNVWFLLSRHDVRRVHEKFSSRRFVRAIGCLTHFGLLSAKTFDPTL